MNVCECEVCLMSLIENSTTELKREYTPNIIKTVAAFANTGGGTLYIGIADDRSVTGLDDFNGTILKISNAVRDGIRPDISPFVEYRREMMDGKAVLCIHVQKGPASPYYLVSKGIRPEGVYVRLGASSVPASETAILRMIKEADGEKYEDVRSLNQALTFAYAEEAFAERGVSLDEGEHKSLGLMTGDGVYTNLGLLLSDQCGHTVKLAVFEGHGKAQLKERREFSGSLLQQLRETFEFIQRHQHGRPEVENYPADAVREALLNALVHRDYAFSDSTLISIFDDRIELVSIGGLVRGITLEDMLLGLSVARNRRLANVFYRLALVEAYGTGLSKIMQSYGGHLVRPQIQVTDHAFKITLPNTAAELKRPPLSENERAAMALFAAGEAITRRDVEAALGVSRTMAGRILKKLTDRGEIKAVDCGKNTRYTARRGAGPR